MYVISRTIEFERLELLSIRESFPTITFGPIRLPPPICELSPTITGALICALYIIESFMPKNIPFSAEYPRSENMSVYFSSSVIDAL